MEAFSSFFSSLARDIFPSSSFVRPMAYPYREPAAAVNLDVCGVPDGDPGPAADPPYQDFRGRDLLVCQEQSIDPGEVALHGAAGMLRHKMGKPYT